MKKILVLLAFTLGFANFAHAGFMVEPLLAYEMGKMKTPDADTQMTNLGIRLGWKSPIMMWVAGEMLLGLSGKYDPDVGSGDGMKRNSTSVLFGADFPILVRAWIGYGLLNQLSVDDDNDTKLLGDNFKIGVGTTLLPYVSINLEYTKDNIKKLKQSGMDDISDPGIDHDSYTLSVSIPFDF